MTKKKSKAKKFRNSGLSYDERKDVYNKDFEGWSALIRGDISIAEASIRFQIPMGTVATDKAKLNHLSKVPVQVPLDNDGDNQMTIGLQTSSDPSVQRWLDQAGEHLDANMKMLRHAVDEMDTINVVRVQNAYASCLKALMGSLSQLTIIQQNTTTNTDLSQATDKDLVEALMARMPGEVAEKFMEAFVDAGWVPVDDDVVDVDASAQ